MEGMHVLKTIDKGFACHSSKGLGIRLSKMGPKLFANGVLTFENDMMLMSARTDPIMARTLSG